MIKITKAYSLCYGSQSLINKIVQVTLICSSLLSCSKSQTESGRISSLNCSNVQNTGSLIAGTTANGVMSTISYNGGNGENYNSVTINSTGVTGLTATLAAGRFANGNGSLTFSITGTPSSTGEAVFEINVGGQACILTRSVARAGLAHSCGATNVHNPSKTYGTVTDIDGNQYKTIQIGTQTWMAENLKTTRYRNGNPIPNVTDNTQWSMLASGAYCSINNNNSFDCPYGKNYNWYTLTDSRGLCPTGWHVPTDAEWTILINNLGGELIAGAKMKTVGTQYWDYTFTGNPNANGITNESGLSLLPTQGRISADGSFPYFDRKAGSYWSITESVPNSNMVWIRSFGITSTTDALRNLGYKKEGEPVRCIKD